MTDTSSSVDLLARTAAGEPAAVREFLDDVAPVVYGFVFARVGGNVAAAEDLTQETLLEACRSASSFRGESALTTWLCAIARRRLARFFERERRQALAEAGLSLVTDGAPVDQVEAEVDRRDEIVRALGRLPVLHRQVLVLKYLDGQSVAEIADRLGRTAVQVQSLLQRARSGLRAALEEEK